MKPARLLLADDHSLILKGIRQLLEGHCEVVGTVENGRDLVSSALELKPDVIVLDVTMPELSGIDAAHELKQALPAVRLVFLSMHSNPVYLRKAFEAGASAYVLKSGAAEELLDAIAQVQQDTPYVSPHFGPEAIQSLQELRLHREDSSTKLTDRQKQLLQLLVAGKQNKEIAELMHLSVRTVEYHRSGLIARLGVKSVAELTKYAIQEGLADWTS